MTEQREFPFFVNGRFWRFMNVEKSIIYKGFVDIPVCTRPRYIYNEQPTMLNMKKIIFQLAECGEQKYNMVAHWTQGFWIVDSDLELDEQKHLYLKDK